MRNTHIADPPEKKAKGKNLKRVGIEPPSTSTQREDVADSASLGRFKHLINLITGHVSTRLRKGERKREREGEEEWSENRWNK